MRSGGDGWVPPGRCMDNRENVVGCRKKETGRLPGGKGAWKAECMGGVWRTANQRAAATELATI